MTLIIFCVFFSLKGGTNFLNIWDAYFVKIFYLEIPIFITIEADGAGSRLSVKILEATQPKIQPIEGG